MKPGKGNPRTQVPLPYAFSRREEFLGLPAESRTTHLWEAYVFCTDELSGSRFSHDELQRNLRILKRMMLQVSKDIAKKLREDGSWANSDDVRWPRHHKGDDLEHWYDSGCFPPQFVALPEDPDSWRQVLSKDPDALFAEMIAWVETPAGQAGVGDVELQKLLSDRDTYLPHTERAVESGASAAQWNGSAEDREESLQWLAEKSAQGSLESWASKLKLAGLQRYLGGLASNRRPIGDLLPDLINLEKAGELEALQRFLDVEEVADGRRLAKLRTCFPSSQ